MSVQGVLFKECQHHRWTILPEKRGPHHAKKICSDCGKFLGWMPKPETVERIKHNAEILSALAKIANLSEWEREFVRKLSTGKKLTPKQQAMLFKLAQLHLKGGTANDGFHGEASSPDRNPSD